ncbi:MAG: hypothetical protein Q9M40_02320 [Sulfurimonas sp.]|nr:hypothetical protein [Sulfurimonas sp.]
MYPLADKVTLGVEAILENLLDDGANNATGQPVTSKQEVKTQAILRHGGAYHYRRSCKNL